MLFQALALLAAVLAGLLAYPFIANARPAPGSAAPDFALKGIDGRNLRLSEYRGDVVVLAFWASWCGPCREALTQLNRLPARAGQTSPVILAVNVEGDSARAAAVAQSLGLTYPVLVDARRSVGRLYEVDTLPLMLLLDRGGVVRGVWSEQDVSGAGLARKIEEANP